MACKEVALTCSITYFATSRHRGSLLVQSCPSTYTTAARHTSRRLLIIPIIALPLLVHTQSCHSSTAEEFVDPSEQALVEALDARDSLTELCDDIKSFTQRTVSAEDLQNPKRALGKIYESLEASLPKVAEQFELEEDIVQELLESVACAQDVFMRSCFTTDPSSGLYNCSKFLELACGQMDEMLEQVPIETLQAMQLMRGIRPVA